MFKNVIVGQIAFARTILREDCLKILLEAGRLSAITAFLVVTCMQAQQPPPQTQPGTPATAAPETTTAPERPPAADKGTTVTLQNQKDLPPQPTGLYAPWSAEIFYWLTYASPSLHGGIAAGTDFESLDYPGRGKYTPGVALSFPVSKTGMLNLSAFITKGTSNTTLTQAANLFSTSYAAGDLLTADYNIKDIKVSLQDLFFPFPRKEGQKWRIKTLWEVQYVNMKTNINAPFAPTTDSSGNALVNTATGTRSVVYPTLGLGAELHPTRNLEFEIKGSGFAIPHHSTIGDTEASVGYRLGAVELLAGGKFFHFKTSVQNAEYFKTTLYGAFAGLRLYPSQFPCLFCRGKSTTASTDNTSETPAEETTVSTTKTGTSTSSSTPTPRAYVRRFSAGPTLSVLGLSEIPSNTSNVTNSSTVTTMYQTKDASQRIGYGLTTQLAITDHFAVAIGGVLRRIGYQFTTTVTTSKPTVVGGVVTTVTTSTNTHEDTRTRLIDVPGVLRYYSRGRHDPGTRFFFEGGGAWRKADQIRTSIDSSDASSVLSCCTTTPATPAHSSAFGIVGGAGAQFTDAFGIKVVPEVHYTRWMSPIFSAFTTHTQQNEVAAGFSLTF